MVTAGNRIHQADLQALAVLANTASSHCTSYIATIANQDTYYQDYYPYTVLGIVNTGSGYSLTDILSDGYGGTYELDFVNDTGSVYGIRPLTSGQLTASTPYNNILISLSGGTGNGVTVTASIGGLLPILSQYGQSDQPTMPFNFPNWTINSGSITNIAIIDGGINYKVSQSLTLNGIPSSPLFMVTSITGSGYLGTRSGAITGIKMLSQPAFGLTNWNLLNTVTASLGISSGSISGSHALFNPIFALESKPTWLTELIRLRSNIFGQVTTDYDGTNPNSGLPNIGLAPMSTCVSGPWPTPGVTDNYGGPTYYYFTAPAATQSLANISMNCSLGNFPDNTNFWPKMTFQAAMVAGVLTPLLATIQFDLKVGGVTPLLCGGYLEYIVGCYQPTTSSTDPRTLITVTTPGSANAFPGSLVASLNNGVVQYDWNLTPTYLSPGVYSVLLTFKPPSSDGTAVGIYDNFNYVMGPGASPNFFSSSIEFFGAEPCNGISSPNLTYRIPVPDLNGTGPNIYGGGWNVTNSGYWGTISGSGVIQPIYYGVEQWGNPQIQTVTTYPPGGVWSALTQPICDANIMQYASMPWNFQLDAVQGTSPSQYTIKYNPSLYQSAGQTTPSTQGNSYNTTLPVESQIELPHWISTADWSPGVQIVDSNYNVQQCVYGGLAGIGAPNWGTAVGSITQENVPFGGNAGLYAKWVCIANYSNTFPSCSWQPSTYYALGATVIDTQGCVRVNIPWTPNQTSGGSSSMSNPFTGSFTRPNNYMPTLIGDTPLTASVSYSQSLSFTGSNNPNLWQLNTLSMSRGRIILPCPHRLNGIPSYPTQWNSETINYLQAPTSSLLADQTVFGSNTQWYNNTVTVNGVATTDPGFRQSNTAFGYFIYGITPMRIGNNFAGDILNPMFGTGSLSQSIQQISVEIGCLRNGSFVSFGSYTTGQYYQVLWPVLTSDELRYSSTERIELNAVAIGGPGNNGVQTWNNNTETYAGKINTGYPLLAAYINDMETILGLM